MFTLMRFLQLNAIVGPYPNQILDGQLIDAVPVMQDFEWVRSQVNANVPSLIGSNTFVPTGSVGGTGNAITLAPNPLIVAYAQGQTFTFVAIATNTGNTTIQTSGLGARTVHTAFGTTLSGGEIQNGGIYTVTDTGSFYVLTNGAQGTGITTFTPSLTFGGAAVGITYSKQFGAYTKVNNILFFSFSVVLTAKGASVGNAAVIGFPFACAAAWSSGIFPTAVANLTFGGKYIAGFVQPASASVAFLDITSAAPYPVVNDTYFSNTSEVDGTGYFVVA